MHLSGLTIGVSEAITIGVFATLFFGQAVVLLLIVRFMWPWADDLPSPLLARISLVSLAVFAGSQLLLFLLPWHLSFVVLIASIVIACIASGRQMTLMNADTLARFATPERWNVSTPADAVIVRALGWALMVVSVLFPAVIFVTV